MNPCGLSFLQHKRHRSAHPGHEAALQINGVCLHSGGARDVELLTLSPRAQLNTF